MSRFFSQPGIVLASRPFGDIHRFTEILTPEYGVISAVANGAQKTKSRLAAATDLYVSGTYQFYHNPVKDSWTVKSASDLFQPDAVRNNLKFTYLAGYCSEIIRFSHAGGDSDRLFRLFNSWMRLGDLHSSSIEKMTVQFILRFLVFSGFYYGSQACSNCEALIAESGNDCYWNSEMSVFCEKCSDFSSVKISALEISYIDKSLHMNLEKALQYEISGIDFVSLLDRISKIIEQILSSRSRSYELYKTINY